LLDKCLSFEPAGILWAKDGTADALGFSGSFT